MKSTVLEQLANFIDSGRLQFRIYPIWLRDDRLEVYVRKAFRFIPCLPLGTSGQMCTTLDIGSIGVFEEFRGQGICTDFLVKAHEMNPWDATFVESVMSDKLIRVLQRLGYKCLNQNELVPNFFKLKGGN